MNLCSAQSMKQTKPREKLRKRNFKLLTNTQTKEIKFETLADIVFEKSDFGLHRLLLGGAKLTTNNGFVNSQFTNKNEIHKIYKTAIPEIT